MCVSARGACLRVPFLVEEGGTQFLARFLLAIAFRSTRRWSVEDSVASDDSVAMRARRGVESTGGRGGRPDAISRRWRQFYCPRPPTSHAVWAAAVTMCTPNHCRLVCQSKKTNKQFVDPAYDTVTENSMSFAVLKRTINKHRTCHN